MSEASSYADLRARVIFAGFAMVVTLFVSAEGYWYLGDGRWSWGDCLYMTVITLATVGYGETLEGMPDVPYARLWTVGVILCGSGILVYWVSSLTALVVEGDLRGTLRRRRMDKRIASLSEHVVVCGAGTTSVHAVRELSATRTPFVIIDKSAERLAELATTDREGMLHLLGDASDDAVLEQAGIRRAKGVLVMLGDDRDVLFCTLSVRALNAKVRIISEAVDPASAPKLLRAGADRVVSPNFIGGMRLASEMIRPAVVEFLDIMLRGDDRLRIEEVGVPESSSLSGKTLAQADLASKTSALLLAVRDADGSYHFNPAADFKLGANAKLIVMARVDDVIALREGIARGRF